MTPPSKNSQANPRPPALQSGVFSKCDQVTDADILRSLITGHDTEDGDSAAEMGAVSLEKGWVACMLKPPRTGGEERGCKIFIPILIYIGNAS